MKEIVVISGKGGTGKTSITAAFAYLGGTDVVIADCDVDAADMHLLLEPDKAQTEDFYSGLIAKIEQEPCTSCGICLNTCRFDAINIIDGLYTVDEIACEGCGYCSIVCPEKCIEMLEQNVGQWYISRTRLHNTLVHAKLGIGAENSGKLVAKVKNEAKQRAVETKKPYVLVDGSPGIGCPVVSSLTGADYVVLVTEATQSGLHDMKRVYEVVKRFNIKAGCIINKHDLNKSVSEEIRRFTESKEVDLLALLPYDESFTKAMIQAKTIIEYGDNDLSKTLKNTWEKIKSLID